jgi:hypothetical protein
MAEPEAVSIPAPRYVAQRRLLYDRDPNTDELLYYERGDEIPASQFGSSAALLAAIHAGHVGEIPAPPPVRSAANAAAATDAALAEAQPREANEPPAPDAAPAPRPHGQQPRRSGS